MKLLAMCITWNRPLLLGRSIHCFLHQTDSDARLLVLDDAGQYRSQEHERWTLVSTPKRYSTMGAKRNAVLDLALKQYPDREGFMLWDDDDVYFPHAASSVSAALDRKCWAQPRLVLEMTKNKRFLNQTEAFKRQIDLNQSLCYGGCWAWRLSTFNELGRFPSTNHNEDRLMSRPSLKIYGSSADSSKDGPWYYYNRLNNSIADEGQDFYTLRGKQSIEYVGDPPIGWNGPNIFEMPMEKGIHQRPW